MLDPVAKHKSLCKELTETFVAKNADYGNSFHDEIEEFGLIVAAVALGNKYRRFKTLALNGNKAEVKAESIRDTLMDMANYAIMTVMEIEMTELENESNA